MSNEDRVRDQSDLHFSGHTGADNRAYCEANGIEIPDWYDSGRCIIAIASWNIMSITEADELVNQWVAEQSNG